MYLYIYNIRVLNEITWIIILNHRIHQNHFSQAPQHWFQPLTPQAWPQVRVQLSYLRYHEHFLRPLPLAQQLQHVNHFVKEIITKRN